MKRCNRCEKEYDDSWKACLHCGGELTAISHAAKNAKYKNPPSPKKDAYKRPAGITVFGWLIIIGSVLNLLFFGGSVGINPVISTYFYLVILPVSIVTGVFLLKLKEWARLAIIVISLLVMVETLATIPHVASRTKEYFSKQFDQGFDSGLEARMRESAKGAKIDAAKVNEIKTMGREITVKVGTFIFMLFCVISLVFNGSVIYYFGRPKIKRCFVRADGKNAKG